MENDLQLAAEVIKNKILVENRNNTYKKRIFSQKIKKEILKFVDQNGLSHLEACKILGLHSSSIKNWKRKTESQKPFKKISISNRKEISFNKEPINYLKIMIHLKLILILIILQIILIIVFHLS